jgi:hypothetical protein
LGAIYVGPAWRKAVHALFDVAVSSWQLETKPVAVRGSRLSVTLQRCRDTAAAGGPITAEFLTLTEVDDGDRMCHAVTFDVDDIDAAFEELDARYSAGEAAAHAQTWSIITRAYASLNRHEVPPTSRDWVHIDHRLRATVDAEDLSAYLSAAWDLAPDLSVHIEAVHRLSDVGAVVTLTSRGISDEGFKAQWRMIELLTVDNEMINRCELFDEADLDAAFASFDVLSRSAPLL